MSEYPTLYEWAGGADAFGRLIDAFYDRVEQDQLLSPFFPRGVHGEHRRNVATWWSEVSEDRRPTPSSLEDMSGCSKSTNNLGSQTSNVFGSRRL